MVRPVERTDAQVVRDVLSGDRDAFRLLVRRYGDVLHGHALRMSEATATSARPYRLDQNRRPGRASPEREAADARYSTP
jgi:hypothetical protein